MNLSARDRIRQAAATLFAEKGFSATATREICQRARVTKPVLYYHFTSKENLYREIVLEAFGERLRELTLASHRGGTAHERLRDVLSASFTMTRRNPRLSVLLFRMVLAPYHEAPAVDYVRVGTSLAELIEGLLREGVRRGELSCEPRETAVAFLGVEMIYSISHLARGKPALDRRLAGRIVQLLLSGCARNSTDR